MSGEPRDEPTGRSLSADAPRAVAAAMGAAAALGLAVEEAVVLRDSNRTTLRLLPADVLARVAPGTHGAAQFEVDLATRLAGSRSPVAALDPRIAPRVHQWDGFTITLWTYYPTGPSRELSPAAYADALVRLHHDMRRVDLKTPHFTDRVEEAQRIVADRAETPQLSDVDRDLLATTLTTARRAIAARGAAEQLLHGEPHPGNVLNTPGGPLFIDLETCCRGPVEFDLAHVPDEVIERYPGIDLNLVGRCRVLILAMVAAWRLDPDDRLPNGSHALRELLDALRAGPPYPAIGSIAGPD